MALFQHSAPESVKSYQDIISKEPRGGLTANQQTTKQHSVSFLFQ